VSAHIDSSGIVCCGNCGAHLVVACSAKCADADTDLTQYEVNPIAALPKPRRERETRSRVTTCTWPGCSDPVAPYRGVGQPPRRCVNHKTKKYSPTGRVFGDRAAA
jgi:hypothetical protein